MGREQSNRTRSRDRRVSSGRLGLTMVELLVVVAILSVLASILLPALSRSREASRRTACQSNLKQLGVVLKMYAAESEGNYYPPTQKWHLNGTPTLSWIRGAVLHPEYISDLNISVCPSDSRAKEFIGALELDFGAFLSTALRNNVSATCGDALLSLGVSYTYTGYAATTSSQLKDIFMSRILISMDESINGNAVFISAASMLAQGCPRKLFAAYGALGEGDIPGNPRLQAGFGKPDDNGATLPEGYRRLREGVTRFLITDVLSPAAQTHAESRVALVYDTWAAETPLFGGTKRFNHIPGGSNVLYLDGHVAFTRLGAVYPVADSAPGTYGEDFSEVMAIVSGSD